MRQNRWLMASTLCALAGLMNACSGTSEPSAHNPESANTTPLPGANQPQDTPSVAPSAPLAVQPPSEQGQPSVDPRTAVVEPALQPAAPAITPPVAKPTTTAPAAVTAPEATPIAPTEPVIATAPATPNAPAAAGRGWTAFGDAANVIYVSSQGQDAWPGTEEQPKASLQSAHDALRDGSADWVLLRRGDTFRLNDLFTWTKSGPHGSSNAWMRLGAYGDESKPRPILDSGAQGAMVITPGWRSDRVIENLAFSDVHFVASARLANPTSAQPDRVAVQLIAVEHQGALPFSRILFENVMVEGYSTGIVSSNDVKNLSLRRNIFHRIFSPGGAGVHSSAVVADTRGVLLLEDNVFYLCQYPGMPGVKEFSYFAHSVYVGAETERVIARGNIIIKAFEGMMQRASGVYENNVSAHNALAYHVGEAIGVAPASGGVEATVRGNLMLNNNGGPNLGNIRGAEISDNLVINDQQGPQAAPNITLIGRNDQNANGRMLGTNVGVHRATIARNHLSGDLAYAADRQDRRHYSDVVFTSNTATVGRVPVSIGGFLTQQGWGGGTIDDLGRRLVAMDRRNFTSTALKLINYYRSALRLPPL